VLGRLTSLWSAIRHPDYQDGGICFAELDVGLQGRISHVRYADSWGLLRQSWRRVCASRATARRKEPRGLVVDGGRTT